ncbi:MAG: HAD family hydrolase [Mariprofundaceae bacterium]|nr:HAD family hydrolase [Mariprofundaceae bacterium]
MSTQLQGVLLDLDGTLINAFPPIIRAMSKTLAEYGLPAMSEQAIRRHTGRGDCSMAALFGEHKAAASQRFVAIHDETYLDDIQPLSGATALMAWLNKQGIPMAVVTSKGQHRAEAQLEKLGWLADFSCVIGKLEGRAAKPNPEPLLLACAAMEDGLNIHDVLMIGDGEADMQAASRAGCAGWGLTSSFSAEELEKAGAKACFASLDEVLLCLQKKIH